MQEPRYRIVFRGQIAFGFERDEVRNNLKNLCRFDEERVERLLAGGGILKSDLDAVTAGKYLAVLERTGALCTLEPLPSPTPQAAVAVANAPAPTLHCPHCHREQPRGTECLHCGIVFERYLQVQARKAAMAAELRDQGNRGVEASTLPADAPVAERIVDYLCRHQEQAFVLKAFGVIAAILLLKSFLSGIFFLILFLFFPLGFLFYVRAEAASTGQSPTAVLAQHITLMPIMYAEGERKKEGVSWLTYTLILLNVLIFYGYEIHADIDFLSDNLVFLPHAPNLWNVPVSAVTALFLHAGNGHLWGNILFLWAVGTVVERRIGFRRFGTFYLLSGLMAGLLSVVVARTFLGETAHGLGASGAISGIMGVFAVRCYFKSMVFPLPILGIFSLILPISLKVRLNSLVIIGLFFLSDLSCGIGQLTGSNASNIGHWAHIGGMLCGIALASLFRLGDEAVEERHMEIGAQALAGGKVSLAAGEESLRLTLRQNPRNTEALLLLARIRSKHQTTEEGRDLYRRAIPELLRVNPKEAASVFREYYQKYLQGIDSEAQYRLAGIFYQEGDLELAYRCIEGVLKDPATTAEVRQRALFQRARILEEQGLTGSAAACYRQIIEEFPTSPHLDKARVRLASAC